MCGICGAVGLGTAVDVPALARMTAALSHRGPDDDGLYVRTSEARTAVGLGFRRLSIIDVAGGHQPLANEDRTVWVILNGEIYNYRSLRTELEGRGHRFATDTDTEVIVHLYEELGPRGVERLDGMFAFAIWDGRSETLVLARDRFGKKPLYYAPTADGLLFGSELKALLEHPLCPRELDDESLSSYLALEYVPTPRSILRGVYKLPAAHVLTWSLGTLDMHRYWQLTFGEPLHVPAEDLAEEFRARFRAAVERRLMSDVPLGAFLSGGIDSSAVVAMMAELLPAGHVKTFSIGFDDPSFDESGSARAVAEHFATDHNEEMFDVAAMVDLLPEVAAFLDEPFADASILPTYLLSRFTRSQVTVALGGDGSDELLAGYPTFPADRAARFYRLPRALHDAVVLPLADRLPVSTANFSLDFKVKRFVRGARLPETQRHVAWLGAFLEHERARLLRGVPVRSDGASETFDDLSGAADPVQRLIHLYARTYLQDDILVKVDRASMAASLEVRAPFLDTDLVEFLGRVPSSFKLRRFQTKHLLKLAMRGILPKTTIEKPKKGFGIPIAHWFKNELREQLLDELSPERLRAQGIFDEHEVERLLREHLGGRRDHRKALWTLFVFQLWHRTWLERPRGTAAPTSVSSSLPA